MTVRSTMKSYCKIIQLGEDGVANIEFKDTLGNLLKCNFISVDCRSQGLADLGYYVVQPSGVYQSTASSLDILAAASATGNHTLSGLGGVVGTADGSVEMSLGSNDSATGMILWNKLVAGPANIPEGASKSTTFIITYGNMKQANPKRDQDGNFYPPGV